MISEIIMDVTPRIHPLQEETDAMVLRPLGEDNFPLAKKYHDIEVKYIDSEYKLVQNPLDEKTLQVEVF